MYKALDERREQRQDAILKASHYALRLQKDIGSLVAILFGSYARGDFNQGSDIDVLILSEELPVSPLQRMELLYRYVEGEIEPKGYTREEFRAMLRKNNPLSREAMEKGLVLLDDGSWNVLKSLQ